MSEENNQEQYQAPEGFKPEEEMSAEELQALQENEDFILNFKEEDREDPDKVEELNKRLKDAQTTIHQKRHYRTKLQAATPPEKKPEEKKPENPGSPAAPVTPGETTNQVDPYKVVTFRQDHPELSKEVVKEIIEYAGAMKIEPEDALSKPVVQSMIKSAQTAEDVENASPKPGQGSGTGTEKRDWSNATPQEIEAQRNKIMYGA